MKQVLLDEGVPRHLANALQDTGVVVVPFPNAWKQWSDGELLARIAAEGFECLITCDKQMPYQQNLKGRPVRVVVLPTNRLPLLREIASEILDVVRTLEAGHFVELDFNGSPLMQAVPHRLGPGA